MIVIHWSPVTCFYFCKWWAVCAEWDYTEIFCHLSPFLRVVQGSALLFNEVIRRYSVTLLSNRVRGAKARWCRYIVGWAIPTWCRQIERFLERTNRVGHWKKATNNFKEESTRQHRANCLQKLNAMDISRSGIQGLFMNFLWVADGVLKFSGNFHSIGGRPMDSGTLYS